MKGLPDGSRFTAWALVTQLGLTMVASIVLGILLGLWLDRQVGTSPLFTLLFSLLGISAASLAGYRAVSAAFAQLDRERTERAAKQGPPKYRKYKWPSGDSSDEDDDSDDIDGFAEGSDESDGGTKK